MKDKIKVIHIVQSLGGVDTSLRMITSYLDDDIFDIIIIKDTNNNWDRIKSRSNNIVKTYELDFGRDINLNDIFLFTSIVKILRNERPDIIHAHSAKCGFLGRIAGSLLNIPTFCTPQAFSFLSSRNKVKYYTFLYLEKVATIFNGKILACSQSEKERAMFNVGLKEKDVFLFENSLPINEEIFPDYYHPFLDEIENFICTIGRPSYQKNTSFLIDAFYSMKMLGSKTKLVLLGVGHYSPDLKTIEKQIERLDLQKDLILVPWSSRATTLEILSKSLCYISFARYEGLPFSVLEAMRAGKPCVVSNVDGNKDCVINNKTGYLVELTDSSKEIALKINHLLNSRDLLKSFGDASQKLFVKRFNIETNIKKLETIYQSILPYYK